MYIYIYTYIHIYIHAPVCIYDDNVHIQAHMYPRKERNGKGSSDQPRSSGSRPQQCSEGMANESRCCRGRLASLSLNDEHAPLASKKLRQIPTTTSGLLQTGLPPSTYWRSVLTRIISD